MWRLGVFSSYTSSVGVASSSSAGTPVETKPFRGFWGTMLTIIFPIIFLGFGNIKKFRIFAPNIIHAVSGQMAGCQYVWYLLEDVEF